MTVNTVEISVVARHIMFILFTVTLL